MTARFDASTIDQRVVIYGKTWTDFEAQVALRGEDVRHPKLAFLDGVVELMSPSYGHDETSRSLAYILGFYMAEVGVHAYATGAWLLKHEPDAGAEPDESFVLGRRGGPPPERPDLVIEIGWTHSRIDKLEIYRRLGIPEVWWWEDGTIAVHLLTAGTYIRSSRSALLPALDLSRVCELVKEPWSFVELQAKVRERLVGDAR